MDDVQRTRATRDTVRNARVVVVGAGFAGASLIRSLPSSFRRRGETLMIDRAEEYPFIPLAHEVAVGRVHPNSASSPIAPLCESRCEFLQTEVRGVDLENKVLHTPAGGVGYEYLVLTAGSVAKLPPQDLLENVQTFWNFEDALRLRTDLAQAWNDATSVDRSPSPGALTVAIVGGGATGVELAGEVAALFDYLRKRTARRTSETPRIVLIEASDRLLGWLDPYFDTVAQKTLADLGVEVWLNSTVEEAHADGVSIGTSFLPARIRVWAAGVEATDIIRELPGEHDASGRVFVDEHQTIPGHSEVYVLGDGSVHTDPRLGPLPPTASVAVQQGPWAARDLQRRLRGASSRRGRPPFRFFDRGYVVSLGPESAVADAVGLKLRGPAAQALYRSIFLYYMKSRRDRLLTGADWAMERTLGRVGFGAGTRAKSGPKLNAGDGANGSPESL